MLIRTFGISSMPFTFHLRLVQLLVIVDECVSNHFKYLQRNLSFIYKVMATFHRQHHWDELFYAFMLYLGYR